MPMSGVPRATAAAMPSRQSGARAVVASKLPTPGTMRADAPAISSGVAGVANRAPRCRRAFRTDVRFPAP